MIKNFSKYINEDYFSKLASRKDNSIVRKENDLTEDDVLEIVTNKIHGKISFRKENGQTVVDVDGDVFIKKYMEEIPFQFGEVTGEFNCCHCKLKSLKGCPKEVGEKFLCYGCDILETLEGCPEQCRCFDCSCCDNLVSLKGAPESLVGYFDCSYCSSLSSLDFSPKVTGGYFTCRDCKKLNSLKGCPESVGGEFNCSDCSNITSLDGCPQKVGCNFYCRNCSKSFLENYVRSLCDVKGKVFYD